MGLAVSSDMVAATQQAQDAESEPEPEERRFVMYGVPWAVYVGLRDGLDERRSIKMTFLEGALELVTTSGLHDESKKILARLLEVWSMEREVDLRGYGSTTFRQEAKERGLEADECYKLGRLDYDDDAAVPDIAIEIIVTNALVDKLAVYAGLGVPEVWEWRTKTCALVINRLVGDRYERRTRSEVLPDLDVAQLVTFVRPGESHLALCKAYQAALRT